jgi:hypothetical protein
MIGKVDEEPGSKANLMMLCLRGTNEIRVVMRPLLYR